MAYTPSGSKTVVPKTFGGLVADSNRVAMLFGAAIMTIDATGTPQTSPLTVNTTATLVVPPNAVQCTIISKTNAVQISEDSTQSAYLELPAGVPLTIDCTRQQNIYLKTSGSTPVSFMFKTI